jgi:hypothetical protein
VDLCLSEGEAYPGMRGKEGEGMSSRACGHCAEVGTVEQ